MVKIALYCSNKTRPTKKNSGDTTSKEERRKKDVEGLSYDIFLPLLRFTVLQYLYVFGTECKA